MEFFTTYFLNVIRNHYADFNGRASRKQYWLYCICHAIVCITFGIILGVLFFLISAPGIIYSVYNILTLALMLPGLSIAVRRLHDVGKSGWFLLILLIPLIGFFWCLYLFCKPSDSGTNQYGNEPL